MASSGKRSSNFDDDDEVYWNSSKNKSRFDFHDDDNESENAKQFAKQGRHDLMLDNDTDSLNGFEEAVVESPKDSIQSQSVRYQRAGSARTQSSGSFTSTNSAPSKPPPLSRPPPNSQPPFRSESPIASHPLSTPQAWADTDKPKSTDVKTPLVVEADHKKRNITPNSISDVVASTAKAPTHSEVAKLNAKIKRLEIQLMNQSVGSLAVEETIKRMLCGKPYLLESYRKLEEKKYLLKCALATHDGNAINSVIMFLKQTLTKSLFQSTLIEKGGAEQYVSLLRQMEETAEAEDIISMIGKSEEAAMKRYRSIHSVGDVDHKLRLLRNCLSSHFELEPTLATDQQHLRSQISLLEIQQIIEKADIALEALGRHPIMRLHKRRGTLPNQPLITTLYYCCLYHYDQPPSQFCSPKYLMERFQLTDAQLQWIATGALSRIHKWSELEKLYAGKNWYGGATKTSAIGFQNVVKILDKTKASPDVLNKYCALISDEGERLRIAKRCKCYTTAIETLILMKDRVQLTQFKSTLAPYTPELQKAQCALNNSSIKWKN